MLEIEEEALGAEVECGLCCEVFVPKKSAKSAGRVYSVKKRIRKERPAMAKNSQPKTER
jgi:hypothetical protein